ncbi:hypothetical protein L211DRAFT_835105 [Terfezia boudieri ATCC MYA-4762]|uniref:Ubiquitin-like 1-activating enzyme E1A n=1 Tax=Terfezia boudieri ATCC MYA-4762 TaxID=1051890 RepID=A0A3N4M051_9PEZI|nr:hypothetical protein L211DRAFT_835105 [Terfezia boudieri ATCC MYA-4762]
MVVPTATAPLPAGPLTVPEMDAITADEVAIYDRQIRLWGMEAQARMRNSKILLIGMRAIANEIAKNLALAGIGSLTVLDPEVVTEDDLASQFFIQEEHIGMNRAEAAAPSIRKLNPRVTIHTDTDSPSSKPPTFFSQFDITIATELDLDALISINTSCRQCSRPFYSAASYGLYGYIFADLISHTFVIERDKSNIETRLAPETQTRKVISCRTKKEGDKVVEFVTKEEKYSSLADTVNCPIDPTWRPRKRRTVPAALPCIKALWEFIRTSPTHNYPTFSRTDLATFTRLATEAVANLDLPADMLKASFISTFVEGCTSELVPVAAILGGVLAQDVINVLGKREQPLQNFLVFDGEVNAGPVLSLHPEGIAKEENGNGNRAKNGEIETSTAEVVSLD